MSDARPEPAPRRARVLCIHPAEGLGGSAKSLGLLISILVRDGFECVVLMRVRDESEGWFQRVGARVVIYPFLFGVGFTVSDRRKLRGRLFRPFRLAVSIPGVLFWSLWLKPDIVHLNDITLGYLCGLFKVLRRPVLVHRRTYFHPKTSLKWNINAYCIRRFATRVISIAESYKRQQITERDLDLTIKNVADKRLTERDITIFDPDDDVACEIKSVKSLDKSENVVLFVGSVGARSQALKGLDIFERAMKILETQRKDVLGFMLGGKPIDKPIQAGNLVYFGSVANTQPYYLKATLIAVPFVMDHCARQIFEAYRSRVPVICSNLPCLAEFVAEGETGLLVNVGDPDALAEGIIKLLDDDDLRKRLVENGSQYFEGLQQEAIAKTLNLFRTIAAQRNQS